MQRIVQKYYSLRQNDYVITIKKYLRQKDISHNNTENNIKYNVPVADENYVMHETNHNNDEKNVQIFKNRVLNDYLNLNNNIIALASDGGSIWAENKSQSKNIGRFTIEEDEKLLNAINKYIKKHFNDRLEGWKYLCSQKKKTINSSSPWIEICSVLPYRHIESCITRAKTFLSPIVKKGRWSEMEKQKLVKLVNNELEAGSSIDWKKIGLELCRHSKYCRDTYMYIKKTNTLHHYISTKYDENSNKNMAITIDKERSMLIWSFDLDQRLLAVIRKNTNQLWPIKNIPWNKIAAEFDFVSPQQCCTRYYNTIIVKSGPNLDINIVNRHIIRYIFYILTNNDNNIHWNNIKWTIPHLLYPPIVNMKIAKHLIVDYLQIKGMNEWKYLIQESTNWKATVKKLYIIYNCANNETNDIEALKAIEETYSSNPSLAVFKINKFMVSNTNVISENKDECVSIHLNNKNINSVFTNTELTNNCSIGQKTSREQHNIESTEANSIRLNNIFGI